ncbi:MAG: outer membrane protein assembly factor BamE [Gammaproteobacteria bacterium]|nr:outer membrane protein assembly factor BamE [Gammaproteobacteria bacterium]
MRKNLIFIAVLTGLILSSCSWLPESHKIDIQQGNRIKQEDLAKLKPGMTRSQVKFVLGSPLLQDSFHEDRWDYIFYLKPGKGESRRSRISLYFAGDKLIRIDDSQYHPEQQTTAPTK